MKGRNVRFLTWRCLEKLAVHLSWTDTSVTGVTGRNDQGQARMSTLGMVCRTRRRDKNILKWSRTGSDKYSTIKWWETKRRQKRLQLNNDDKEHKERGANRKTTSQQWFLMTKDWWSKLKNSDRELHYFKKPHSGLAWWSFLPINASCDNSGDCCKSVMMNHVPELFDSYLL